MKALPNGISALGWSASSHQLRRPQRRLGDSTALLFVQPPHINPERIAERD